MKNVLKFVTQIAILILPPLLGSGAFIAGKFALTDFSPLSLTFLRFFVASSVMVPLMFLIEKRSLLIKKDDIFVVLILCLLGVPVYHMLFFVSLQHTSSINAGIITATIPMTTSVLSSVILKESITVKKIGAIFIAFVGVCMAITDGNIIKIKDFSFNYGDIVMMLAVVAFSLYGVLSKKVIPRYSPLIITFYSFVLGSMVLAPLAFAHNDILSQLASMSLSVFISLLYMSIVASCLAYIIQQIAIKTYGASKTMLFYNFVPIYCIILSAIFLNEHISLIHIISATTIIVGVYIYSKI